MLSFLSELIVLLEGRPSSLSSPSRHVERSALSPLSNQAEQLVPKETGGWLPARMNGFHGNSIESLALGEDPCQQPHLVLALLFGCVRVVYTSDTLMNSPSQGVGPWNSFIPACAPLTTQTENQQIAAVLSTCPVNEFSDCAVLVFIRPGWRLLSPPALSGLNNWTNGWGPDCDTEAGIREWQTRPCVSWKPHARKISSGRKQINKYVACHTLIGATEP